MPRGRPIAIINKTNAQHMLTYFNNIIMNPKGKALFFLNPTLFDNTKKDFEKIAALALGVAPAAPSEFEQTKEDEYHRVFCHWLDVHITEAGFQRALRAFHQKRHRTKSEQDKKIHLDMTVLAYEKLNIIASKWGVSKQTALERALKIIADII